MASGIKTSRRRSLSRQIKRVCAVFAVFVLAVYGLWYWIDVPYHQFTVSNISGKDVEMKSVQIDDVLIPYYHNVVLETYSNQRKNIFSQDNIFLYKRFRKARIAVRFQFLDEEETREYVSEVTTGWKFECRFFVWIEVNMIRTSECRRPEIYDFD